MTKEQAQGNTMTKQYNPADLSDTVRVAAVIAKEVGAPRYVCATFGGYTILISAPGPKCLMVTAEGVVSDYGVNP